MSALLSEPKIDAHQHFWQYNPAEHGWMTDEMASIRRDFLPPDLKPLLDRAGFNGCVAVQARQSLDETRWLLQLAGQYEFIHGVVGWVDLRSANLEAQLGEFSGQEKLVGVRHVVQDEPDDAFMMRDDFRRGIAQLASLHLTYDVLIYPRQLPAAIRLVEEFASQRFVLDHIAKPLIGEGKMEPWAAEIRTLAQSPNLYCKLSGMVTETRWKHWREADFRPYLDVVFEAFGPDRLMIGSDWPVCTLSASYESAVGIVFEYIRQFSAGQQAVILGGNCRRFYKLPPVSGE
jgi:L-fuconolactonase